MFFQSFCVLPKIRGAACADISLHAREICAHDEPVHARTDISMRCPTWDLGKASLGEAE